MTFNLSGIDCVIIMSALISDHLVVKPCWPCLFGPASCQPCLPFLTFCSFGMKLSSWRLKVLLKDTIMVASVLTVFFWATLFASLCAQLLRSYYDINVSFCIKILLSLSVCFCSTSCARWRKSSLALRESLTWWPTMPAPSATLIPWSRPTIRSALTWRLAKSQTSSSLTLVSATILLLFKILMSSRALTPDTINMGLTSGHMGGKNLHHPVPLLSMLIIWCERSREKPHSFNVCQHCTQVTMSTVSSCV